jgi:hypothetical protein
MGARRTQWLAILKRYRPDEARRLLQAAIAADPTAGQGCVTWILRQLRDQYIELPASAEQAGPLARVRDLLVRWQEVKAAGTFAGAADINAHNYYGLRALVERAERAPRPVSMRQQQKQIKRQGTETVYEGGRYRIVRVTDPETAVALARGTRWCTSNVCHAEDYLEAGPLHMVLRDGVRYAQLHVPAGALRDEQDRQIVPDTELTQIVLELFCRPGTWWYGMGLGLVLGQ